MTYDDDLVVFRTPRGDKRVPLVAMGMQWPPPQFICVGVPDGDAVTYEQASCSSITDEQRAGMTHVIRAALYLPTKAHSADAPTATIN